MSRPTPLRRFINAVILLAVFLALPLVGVLLRGGSPATYLRFPPENTALVPSSFSWIAFIAVILFIIVTTRPFCRRMMKGSWSTVRQQGQFPRWGWAAMGGLILFWILAWTRFTWFEPLQRHTFFPLWFCFIILLNAIALRISGKSLLTHRPRFFTLLFPVSALSWWGFEYLNQFLNNWYYTGTGQIGDLQYFGEASLAFSTVLPAVLSIRYILMQTEVFSSGFRNFPEMPWVITKSFRYFAGILSFLGLIAIGWMPEETYPLVWIVPGLLWIVYQQWNGYSNPLLKEVSIGDFTLVWASAFAAMLCGFFWEMWNIYSEAKWIYSVPYLDRFRLFEMPLLGFAGYLPFGVICALISNSLLNTMAEEKQAVEEEIDR